jgi:threonyl-tRNA synthetase
MLILGDKEAETNKITVRRRNGENFELIDPEKFIEFITKEIKTKKQNLEVVQ